MKTLSLALILSLLTIPSISSAKEKDSYVAKLSESGKFCARVALNDGSPYARMKKQRCRTIEQWKEAGYDVDVKKPVAELPVIQEATS